MRELGGFKRLLAVVAGLAMLWLVGQSAACGEDADPKDSGATGDGVVTEQKAEATQDAGNKDSGGSADKENTGLGVACTFVPRIPKGDCKGELICLPVNDGEATCFQDCTFDYDSCPKGQQCLEGGSHKKLACFVVAKAGEACGFKKRVVCDSDNDPGLVCQDGKCAKAPSGGWKAGYTCTYDHRKPQSDCSSGLVCLKVSEMGNGRAKCFAECGKDGDCPSGEVCAAGPDNKKVCFQKSGKGEPCGPLSRRICNSTPTMPLKCVYGKCKQTEILKKQGEQCKGKIGDKKGDCLPGLYCLSPVMGRPGYCYKPCKQESDCPSGEICTVGAEGEKTCLIPRQEGQDCDMTKRKLCRPGMNPFLGCVEGKCVAIKLAGACTDAKECGPIECKKLDGGDANGFCLFKCSDSKPCPAGAGNCTALADQSTFCIPPGQKKSDEQCDYAPDRSGQVLNTTAMCGQGMRCLGTKGQKKGVCMKTVKGCGPGACPNTHVCLKVGKAGVCALDCSKNQSVCKANTKCTKIQGGSICLSAQ